MIKCMSIGVVFYGWGGAGGVVVAGAGLLLPGAGGMGGGATVGWMVTRAAEKEVLVMGSAE